MKKDKYCSSFLPTVLFIIIVTFTACEEELPPEYLLNIEVNNTEGGITEGEGSYTEGEEVNLKAIPNEGFVFLSWTKEGNEIANDANLTYTMPAQDITLHANFEKAQFHVSLLKNLEDAGDLMGEGEYEMGDEVIISATVNDFFRFLHWKDEENIILSTDSVYTFTMPATNVIITAIFEKPEYWLQLNDIPGGTGVLSGSGYYHEGDLVEINAVPVEFFDFSHWEDETGSIIGTNPLYHFTMPPDSVILTAFFVLQEGYLADIDGNIYPFVTIGPHKWMAENLKTTRFKDETTLETNINNSDWGNYYSPAYAIYPHDMVEGLSSDEETVSAYGLLYNWHAVNDPAGLCPAGWRIPNDDEWTLLINYLIQEYDLTNTFSEENKTGIGNALKSCRQTISPLGGECNTNQHPRWETFYSPGWEPDLNQVGLDMFGFSALPSGYRNPIGFYAEIGESTTFWSSTPSDGVRAWTYGLAYVSKTIYRNDRNTTTGLSVRCIRDTE